MAVTGNTHTWTLNCKPSGLPALPSDVPTVLSAPAAEDIEATVLVGQNLQVFAGLIDHTKISSLVMHSTLGNVTVFTNSNTGAGGQVIALGTAKALGWNNVMAGVANPITGDITQLWVDNTAGTKDTVFRASFLTSP